MNKLLLLLLFLFSIHVSAQDSLAVSENNNQFITASVPIDSSSVIKKSFPENLQQKYTDKEFRYESKTPEKNAWDRFKAWLADILRNIFRFSSERTSLAFVTILLKTIAVLIVIFVIYLIVKAVINKEGKWIFGRNSDRKIINYSELEKNLLLIDFEKLIRNSLDAGENRLTIRYYYLWLLKRMAEKQIIVWDIEKTNSDYLYEISNQSQKEEFAYLSYLYNYIWYGEFELDTATFEKAKTAFEKALKSVNNG